MPLSYWEKMHFSLSSQVSGFLKNVTMFATLYNEHDGNTEFHKSFITIYSFVYRLGYHEAIVSITLGYNKAIILLLLCFQYMNHYTCK